MKLSRKIALFAIAIFFALNAFAQKISFTDTSNKWTVWHISDGDLWPHVYLFSLSQDVMIDSLLFRQLNAYPASGLVREDTVAHKVFFKGTYIGMDTNLVVLYDYNWHIGDTVAHNSYVHIIDSSDNRLINGLSHKVWHFQPIAGPASMPYYVIEGVGSTAGPLFPILPDNFEQYFKLVCFSNQSTTPLVNPVVGYFDNATSCALSVDNAMGKLPQVQIVPNPINKSSSKIVFGKRIELGEITIYNTIGQKVISATIHNINDFPLTNIHPPGLYYYDIIADGKHYKGKFLCE